MGDTTAEIARSSPETEAEAKQCVWSIDRVMVQVTLRL
jgi:hypothetical protein